MTKRFRGILAFLLAFTLFFGVVPPMSAAALSDTADTTAPQAAEGETAETTSPMEETPLPETSSPTAETSPTEETSPMEDTPPGAEPDAPFEIEAPSADDGIMMASSTAGSIYLFDLASPNYTISLNKQLSIKYKPNGTGASVTAYLKNLGWHFAQYNGIAYSDQPIYCIEPSKNYAASTPGNYMDTDVTVRGSGGSRGENVWYAMPESYRRAITLVLIYSDQMWNRSYSVKTTSRDNNPNTALHLATQFLIYEVAMGLRNADTFEATGNGYADGDILYNAGCQVSGFASNYNSLVDQVKGAMKLPSFVGSTSANAPTIDLNGDLTTVTDYNGVLPYFNFPDGAGASFSRYGDTLYIEKVGDISASKVYSCYRNVPSADNSTVALYYGGASTYQTCVRLYSPSTSNLYGYFKLYAEPQTGNLSLTKTTSDGKNLQGWRFGIYTNSACTNLVSGPHTTNASGKLNVQGMTAGTYYVKELGHKDASINAQYTCTSTNPQRVTISAGATASVKFHNALNTGTLKLEKQTNTGLNLGGWKIGVYTDAACTQAIPGSPFTTAEDGTFLVDGLQPNTYYVKELPGGDGYWECDTSVKAVTVAVNQTAVVTFRNIQYGRIQFEKTTNTGNHLAGWVFRVRDVDGKVWGDYTTDATGRAITENLPLGKYFIQELPTEDDYWQVELGLHDVMVKAGQTVTDKWHNVEQGLGWFHKETNTGESVEGWKIGLYRDEPCTQEVAILTTNAEGKAGMFLNPGVYYAKEVGDTLGRFEDEYWMVDERVQKLEIRPHEDTSVTFTNIQYGKLAIQKSMEGEGPLDGWRFKITDTSGAEITGSPFTSATDGSILTENLLPGQYTVEEIFPENSLYYCQSDNPQTVTVVQGQTAKVSFVNALRPGKVIINKIDVGRNPLAGAKFLLEWSRDGETWEPVRYSDKEAVVVGGCGNPYVADGCLVSGSDGKIEWDNLYPGLRYRVTELEAPEGYVLLSDYAFEGELPIDDLTVVRNVVNCHGYTLPETGSNHLLMFQVLSIFAMTICVALPVMARRGKESSETW